ncbi:nicotinate-nucleotide--dimethylbenzimidazole phosphoribosyltransferase [Streptomyces sp. NPDC017993]|uniref:nicotinate-nucleotide--dimethylbenzimidazole phosphoribosyltransferase n=1 Tax=Streptomyces sp. NPDC017993 TaxID=3365027 RepID=UPI0037906B07
MTDTGQVPGEGQPENAGGHPRQPQPAAASSPADAGPMEQPGMVTPPDTYPYLDPADSAPEDDDLLLMPGAQGAWSEQQAQQPLPQPQEAHQGAQPQPNAPEQSAPFEADPAAAGFAPMPAPAGDHESGGRDSGSVDLSAVRIPQPAAPQQNRAQAAAPATPPRRPLHMGPPVPDATGGVVRSLADRGPAGAPAQPAARHAGPPATGPEYLDDRTAGSAAGEQPAGAPSQGLAAGEAQPSADPSFQDVAYAERAFAAPSYGGQSYAEQAYGAAGQGPLPGPQLGEIPSQAPAWNDASAQAVAAPVAESAAPEALAAPAPQDAPLPAGQPQPLPAEGAAEAAVEDATAGPDNDTVPADEAPVEAPAQPQDAVTEAIPDAVIADADGSAAEEAPAPEAPDAQDAADAAAPETQETLDAQETQETQVNQEAQHSPEATPAPETPEAPEAPQVADAPDAVSPPAPEAAAAPEPEASAEAPQQPVEESPAPEAEAAPPTVEAATDDAPIVEAPAADVPVEQPAADQQAASEGDQVAEPDADGADEPQPAADPATQAAEPPQPVAEAQPADAPEDRQADETGPAGPPAETVEAAQLPAAEDPAASAPEPASMPAAAPQGPVAMPAPQEGADQEGADEVVIEQPEAERPDAGTQPGAPEDAEGQQNSADQAPAAAEEQAAPQNPTGEEQPLPAAPDEVTAPADETADAAPVDVEPAAEVRPVVVHIPAQATGEQPVADPVQEPAVTETEVLAGEPADDTSADAPHRDQDGAELVQLGEGYEDAQDQDRPGEVEQDGRAAATAAQQPADADTADPAAPSDEFGAPGTPVQVLLPTQPQHQDGSLVDNGTDPSGLPIPAPAIGYDDSERAAVHRVMRERRDIRNGFRSDPIPNDILLRVLEAAHTAPSVGHSQPWDFVVIRSDETREKMHQLAMAQREAYAKSLPKARAKQFRELKIEAILETPVNIVVTADSTRGGRHTLGRHTQPQMAPYSSALAVENLWLAARAEGLGVGWVSFFDEREMVRELGLPDHLEVVAYLCIGYVDEFPDEPELMQAGWAKRRPLSWVVHEETYGRRALPGEAPHDLLQETLQGIRPLDAKALGEAWERQKRMTKPAGALGMLEIISAQLSGLSRKCPPPIPEPAAVAIFAGDHGVHAQGVTPWPQEVTGQMVANFLGGGAVCNAFANQVGAEVCVVDVGVAGDLPATPGLLPRKVRPGTDDFTVGPAMSHEDVLKAIEVGIDTARDLVAAGNKALLTGEMGIANTTTSAALIAVYTGVDPVEVTGRGTGINDETHARKVDVVRRALELHQPDPADPIGVLAAVGGLEHAALVGLILGGASLRTPVILDGVSAGAAALVARAIAPEALAACIAGHRSAEPGHVAALTKLGLRPLVDLDLRLGEGTGALLALPVVQSAARAMHEVATFDSAGVTEKG